jgi:hypothetical protein
MAGRKSHGGVKCRNIYPILETRKQLADLKTVGFQLSKEEAIDLARKLLGVALSSSKVDVTAFRLRKLITVTTPPA